MREDARTAAFLAPRPGPLFTHHSSLVTALFLNHMATPDPMPLELEKKLYYDGIQLFNDHEFFEAHEAWEDIWHHVAGVKHSFYQGMIQCAVALEHYRRSNPRGVISLYQSYRKKFENVPGVFM